MKAKILLITCIISVLFSCNAKHEDAAVAKEEVMVEADAVTSEMAVMPVAEVAINDKAIANTAEVINVTSEKKIIKDGAITVKAGNLGNSKKAIDGLLKKWNAYYDSEELQNNEQSLVYNLKVRIPANNFEKLLLGIENGKDKIEAKSIQTKDVTAEYVDTEARLVSKREYLKRYKQLLANASSVKDLLAIEDNIRTLQEEIESKEGQLKFLKDQVSYSTLNITLYEEKELINKNQEGFLGKTANAFKQGWASIVDFVLWTVAIWPYLIAMFVAFILIKRFVKTRKNK